MVCKCALIKLELNRNQPLRERPSDVELKPEKEKNTRNYQNILKISLARTDCFEDFFRWLLLWTLTSGSLSSSGITMSHSESVVGGTELLFDMEERRLGISMGIMTISPSSFSSPESSFPSICKSSSLSKRESTSFPSPFASGSRIAGCCNSISLVYC